jgi:HrpA-like helicases
MTRKEAQVWCSDTLHSIIGCSDSALAMFLTTEAGKASSHHSILNLLQDANVTPVHAQGHAEKQRILTQFAKDLFQKCQLGNGKGMMNPVLGRQSMSSAKAKKMTNADWIRRAENNYDLVQDLSHHDVSLDDASKKARKASSTATSTSTSNAVMDDKMTSVGKNAADKNVQDKQEDRKRITRKRNIRRRRRSSSTSRSSSSDDDDDDQGGDTKNDSHNHGDRHKSIRRRYEEKVEGRRWKRESQAAEKQKRHSSTAMIEDDDSDAQQPNGKNSQQQEEEESSRLTQEQRAELERERDLRERDEFAKRLLARDQKKTLDRESEQDEGDLDYQKRLDMEQRLARGETIYDEKTGDQITLQTLREESRRAYLKKRTERELTLLERELAEEEELFDVEKLTEAEKKRLALRREVLKLAKGESRQKETNDEFYKLPDEYEEQEGRTKAEKDKALLKSRYVEEKREKTEQELWEEEQTRKASIRIEKKGKHKEKRYDLVFEDQIDFIMTDKREGYDHRGKKSNREKLRNLEEDTVSSHSVSTKSTLRDQNAAVVETYLTKHEKILAGRKKLPVFPYREEFLAAVKDHQVLILVGETGSGKT